jgi:tetratricopeptide (TPR) repeat protein
VAAKDYGASRSPFHEFDPNTRLAQASASFWFLLGKTLFPADLIAYYRLPPDLGLHEPSYLLATVAALGFSLAMLIGRKRWPAPAAAWWSYLVILLPNLGLIQFSQQLSADRYSYLAIMGPTILLAGAMVRWFRGVVRNRKVFQYGTVLAFVGTAGILIRQTRAQTLMWRDSEVLWESTLAVDEKCAVAHCNLGEALLHKDQVAEASRHLSRAIDIDAKFAFAYANLGVVYCQARRFDDAVLCGQYAVSLQPGLSGMDLARVHAMLGEAYAGLRQDSKAWEHTRIAQKLGLAEAQKMIDYLSRLSPEPAQKTPSNSH